MSGGSYSYVYCRVEEECVNRMFDSQLNEMMKDLVKVLPKIDVQKQIESEFEKTKDELMKEFKYLNDDE